MSGDLSVFRTKDPARLAAWEQWKADATAWEKRLAKLVKEMQPGPSKRAAMMSESYGGRRFVGYEATYNETPPEGWRVDKTRGYRTLVPRLSTKAGKAAQAKIAALGSRPYPADALAGMPTMHFAGMAIQHPGAEVRNGVLYVKWGTDTPPTDAIDADVWEPVRLSEWYALIEAAAEARP